MTTQKGFSVISAILILSLMASFGIALTFISNIQQRQKILDLESARAYQSSKAGIEWGLYQIQNPLAIPACFSNTNLTMPDELSDFTVSVSCSRNTHNESTQTINVYTIISNACNKPSGGACPNTSTSEFYVERQLRVTTYR